MTLHRLGGRLRLDSGTLSPLLRRLESSGLVVRSRNADDERSILVKPTLDGRRLRERAAGIPLEVGTCIGADARTADLDVDVLRADLHRLEEALRERE